LDYRSKAVLQKSDKGTSGLKKALLKIRSEGSEGQGRIRRPTRSAFFGAAAK
jgi:hypothetical protein